MKKVCLIIFLLLPNLIILPIERSPADEGGEELKLILGEAKILAVSSPTRIVIGNPNIADVTSASKNEIIISPKATGVTTLVFWDNFGEQSYRIKVIPEDMDELKKRVDNLLAKLNLAEVYTKAEESEGKILLLGNVKNPQERERIFAALGTLKDKAVDLVEIKEEESTIEIDVQVLELNKDATNTLGFTWPGSITLTDSSAPTTTATKFENVFRVTNFTRTAFNVTLDALVQEGKVRVLSRPKLACQSGKEAELLVGGEKPILTTTVAATTGAQGTAVEYKEFGIKLKIKPTVTEEKRIKLALNMEVSEIGESIILGTATQPTAKAFPLTKRTASTELYLDDGQTMAIGGLVKQKKEEDIRKTPGLGDLPLLGIFFRKKTTKIGGGQGERGDTELFIALTPTIVHKEEPKNKRASLKGILKKEEESQASHIPANLVNYVKAVQLKILNAAYYPKLAKNAGWEGNVTLSLKINSNGYLKGIRISQSSGYKILDDAALEVVQSQAPYPPFPPQIDSQELWVDVPIVYKKN